MRSHIRKMVRHYEEPQQARFLTFSCYHRSPLFLNDAIKRAFVDHIITVRTELRFRLHAWVIMPEHVHLVLVPLLPNHPVPMILRSLKQPFARRVLQRWRTLSAPVLPRIRDAAGRLHFWQAGPGYDRNIRDEEEYFEKIEYIHANPVTRGLADRTVDYPWSSARWYAGETDAMIDLDE